MGKKKGAKKGVGDDYWDEAGESVPPANGNEDDAPEPQRKSAFAAMSIEDHDDDGDMGDAQSSKANGKAGTSSKGGDADAAGDDDDFGGLMGAIKKSNAKDAKKGGKKNKKKQQQDDDIWDELGEDVSGNALPKKQDDMDVDAAPQETAKPAKEEPAEKPSADGSDEDADEKANDTPRLMTKKEKEKLKKEKEKAKKKAQSAAKKSTTDDAPASPAPAAVEAPVKEESAQDAGAGDEDDEGEEGDAATSADKKKKKKKKKGAETKAEPTPAATKKPSAAVQALQARMAAQRKAEEEARLAEEEARRQEEEAERLEKEEAERKEAERARKKEKEKAKREQLKKEGKLLTPKQKAEKAAAEARMQQMIASGAVKVDGLMNREKGARGEEEGKERKRGAVNDRKKKKGPSGPPSKLAPVEAVAAPEAFEEAEVEPVPEEAVEEKADGISTSVAPEESKEEEDVKDAWDAASNEDVKDDWDAESDDEETKAAKASAAAEKKKAADAASAATREGKTPAAANGKAAPAAEGKGADAQGSSEEDGSSDDSDEDSDEESEDDDGLTVTQRMAMQRKADAEKRRQEKHEAAMRETSKDNLRSPICCIMGHVDTGKTKLLDKVRQTNVQEGEAGGITQQIGATYFPEETLRQKIAPIDPESKQEFKIPGLLVIDTPGHESFTNLRTRGSSLCNIAILVVDIMHGLEQQTLESIRLLRDRKTPFIVALNKIDRLYGWKPTPDGAFLHSLKKQDRATQNEFEDRLQKTIVLFAEQGLNALPYYENKNFAKNVSLVPTSAHTGEGIPDMLQLLVNLTQDRMTGKLMYLSELECTVLEVKVIEGLGTTIDVILSNGVMREGDKIVLCGLNGPIVTQVRALLTPQPLKEMRVKGSYVHHKLVKAALGVKISAPDLEKAIAGSRLLVCGEDDDEEELKEEVMSDLTGLLHSIDKSGRGVCVQASTLGSLEALLEFLKQMKIPVNGINIGPVYKRDIMRCSTMLEKAPDLAVMLCFDVDIDKDAEKLAEDLGVKIFSARIIYHLFDAFVAHQKAVLDRKQKASADTAVWPCRLRILAVFAKRSPLILGCEIAAGDLRLGTPICVKHKESGEIVHLGRVTSLEVNHKRMDIVTPKTAGAGVAVRIECAAHESARTYGRHFTDQDELLSQLSRQSIDTLKELFWDQVSIEQKKTIKALKPILGIP